VELEDGTQSVDINYSTDVFLWKDVCQATAWFDRAQKLFGNTSTVKTDPDIVIDCAQKALSLYQGCFARVKKRSSTASAAVKSRSQDPPEMGVGINLELRIAQTLRLLAAVHAATDDDGNDVEDKEEYGEEKDGDNKHHHFKAAVQYHDDAVSLLVGVFEDEEENSQFSSEEENVITGDVSLEGGRDQLSSLQINNHSGSAMPKDTLNENDHFTMATAMGEVGSNNNILLTIQVPSDERLLQHTTFTSQPKQVSFLIPAEEQRVRAIAMSLNAMAELHAKQGNDGAAMESFREALEILRAATEEQEENESLSGNGRQNETKSRVEVDLANTLQAVGNFHLRRDELDAAFNAYSTVWALYNGSDDMTSASSQDGVGGASLMIARESPSTSPDLDRSRLRKKTIASENNDVPESLFPGALAALNNLGIVHERRGELEEALSCYDQILRARIESLGSDHFDTANAFVNIGNCYQRKLEWEKAAFAYKEATSIYDLVSNQQQACLTLDQNGMIRLQRSLAGVLRNWGTCCWKQRRIAEAIDLLNQSVNTEEILISDSLELAVPQKIVRASYESMAQMLGILGCLYVEHNIVEHRSFQNSEGAFTMALQIYEELGYEETDPAVVWANNNLASVRVMGVRSMTPPPPPAPTPPKASPEAATSDEIDFDEIDSVDLDEVLGDGDDSVFSGVDDSTEELDEILSSARHLQNKEHPGGKHEEVDFDGSPNSKPLSQEQLNLSRTSLTSEQDRQEKSDRDEGESNEDKEEFLLQQKGSYGDESIEAAEAHMSLAEHLWEKGDRDLATDHFTEAHAVFHSRLGDCKEVAMILKSLGDLNKEDGKLEASKELYSEALDIEMSVFGHHRPQTLNAAGVVCLMLDDFRAAMEYHRRALQIQKKKLAAEHKYEMFETLVLIGNVYYSERNNLSNIRTQGVDYKDFIESGFLGWIANAHDMRGEYGKAIQFYEESLQMATSRSSKESKKETALTLNRLGSLTRELGRYEEAMDYHKRALSIQKNSSQSVAKAMTAETCVLMGMVKAKTGEYSTALNLFEDAVLTLKDALGEKHLSVTKTLAQIGQLHFQLSSYVEAFANLEEAERIQLETVGEMNRDTLETQALLGRVLTATGEYDSASTKLNSVVEKQQSLFGANHPSIAESNQFIAENFLEQGMSTEARGVYVEVYNMRKTFFTMDQIQMAESMVDVIRARNGRPERALAIYRNAMDVYREYLPDDHVLIGRLLVYEGDAHAELLEFPTSIELYEKARKIFRKSVGDCAIDSAQVAVNMGKVLLRKCDYDGAKEEFNAALSHYNQLLPENHPKVTSTLSLLGRVEEEEALCV